MNRKIFGTDGIRGPVNHFPINAATVLKLGVALGKSLRRNGRASAVIGRDTRRSGQMLENAISAGLTSAGCDVLLASLVPTPAVARLTREFSADCGIMLTASHNHYDDNGLKVFARDGYKLEDRLEEELERLILNASLPTAEIRSEHLGLIKPLPTAAQSYAQFVQATVKDIDLGGLRVVLDCANGAACQLAPRILRELGIAVIATAIEPDGCNINANCGALHPGNMAQLVRQHDADLGIALDGDADRVIFADAQGNLLDGDRILAILAIAYQKRQLLPHNTVVLTTMSNLGLHEALQRHKITARVVDVGDRYVIAAMRQGGYALGGEKSGHLILHDFSTTGDGIISALQLMRIMRQEGRTLAELAACMREYPQRLISLPVRDKPPIAQLEPLQNAMRECEKLLAGQGRINVRYSGTEPILRLMVEARQAELVDLCLAKLEAGAAPHHESGG